MTETDGESVTEADEGESVIEANGESVTESDADDEGLPACPRCGRGVLAVTSRGPTEHHATPCGCRIADPRLL